MPDPVVGAAAQVKLGAGPLVWARVTEQTVYAGATLVLAAHLGPEGFAPVGVLLILNSFAITLSDFGVGLRVMRLPEGGGVPASALRGLRAVNLCLGIVALLVAGALDGEARVLVAALGVIWAISAESYVRKSAALRQGASRRVAVAEVGGSLLLAIAVGMATANTGEALAWVAIGLVAKHGIEVAMAHPWRWAFLGHEPAPDWFGLWGSQALAYLIANIDFLVVGLLFDDQVLALYVLAFRIAIAIPSQVAFVASRLTTVDLASVGAQQREGRYLRYCQRLFVAGLVGALLTAAAAPIVQQVLGSEWRGLAWCVTLLAVAAPWRTVLGLAGTVAIVSGAAQRLLRWEVVRLGVFVLVITLSGRVGFAWLVAAVVVLTVASVVILHGLAGRVAHVRTWPVLRPAAALTVGVLAALLTASWSAIGSLP